MSYRRILAGFLTLMMLMVIACAPKEAPSSQPKAPEAAPVKEGLDSGAAQKSSPAGWEAQWEKTAQAARKEGTVTIYSSSVGPSIKEMTPLFNKRFGLRIDLITARGAELTARLITERKAGLYMPDVILTGMTNFFNETRPAGAADPMDTALMLPDVTDPKNWFGERLPWGDAEHRVFMSYAFPNNPLAINTELVKSDEIKSYRDLLNPKWKGKMILNDPSISGVGLQIFGVLGFYVMDLDFFRQLAKQEPVATRDQRQQVEWLAQGKYHILIFPRPAPMMEFKRAGAAVAYGNMPVEGTNISVGGGNISLVNRAPHPNAARLFINWFLSKEGQTLITAIEGAQSARLDVPTDSLDPSIVRQPGAKYFIGSDSEEFQSKTPEHMKAAREIFGSLIR